MDALGSDENLALARHARMNAPLIWARIDYYYEPDDKTYQYRIEDLQEAKFDEALSFVAAHFPKHEVTFPLLDHMNDKLSTEEGDARNRSDLYNRVSLVAIDERTGRMVGVIINRILADEDYGKIFVKVVDQLAKGESLKKIFALHQYVEHKGDVYNKLPSAVVLQFRCTATRHRLPGVKWLKEDLIKASLRLATSLGATCAMGIFTSAKDQKLALRVGLKCLVNVYYLHYVVDGVIEFEGVKYPNFGAGIYGTEVPPKDENVIYSIE